jgi:protein-tyrosine phosphatase
MKCSVLEGPGLMPGWGCCRCRQYNGNQRQECSHCGHERCIKKDMIDANEIIPGIYQGSKPPKGLHLRKADFTVLVLSAMEYQPAKGTYPGVAVVYAPLDDAELTSREWEIAKKAALQAARAHRSGKKVLITCYQGLNRSGLITALALHMITGNAGAKIVNHIRRCRAGALSNSSFTSAIERLPARR